MLSSAKCPSPPDPAERADPGSAADPPADRPEPPAAAPSDPGSDPCGLGGVW